MTTRKKSMGWLCAILMAVFMIVASPPQAQAQKNVVSPAEVDGAAALQAQYDAWVAQATAEIEAVDVNHVLVTNQVYTMHELTALANTLPGTNNDSGRIDYIVKLPGTFGHAIVDEGFLFRLGAGVGMTYSIGNKIEPALMWNPTSDVVFLKTDCGGLIAIEPNSIVAFGDIVTSENNAVETAPNTGSSCNTTCDPGFWCCGNNSNGIASCTCVRNTVQNPTCATGGVGARTCGFEIAPPKKLVPNSTNDNQ